MISSFVLYNLLIFFIIDKIIIFFILLIITSLKNNLSFWGLGIGD